MRVLDDEEVSYGPLVGGGLRQPEGADHALRADRKCYLEPVNPLGLGGAPPEGGLPGKQPLARSPYPHDGRNEGGVQDVVDLRSTTERSGQLHAGSRATRAPQSVTLRLSWLWEQRLGK